MQSSEQEGNEAVREKEEIMKDQVNMEEKKEILPRSLNTSQFLIPMALKVG